MIFREEIDLNEFLGYHTILYGETNTKKTYYTAKFVQFLVESKNINPSDITILDFAPKLTKIRDLKIGGKIEDFYPQSIKCNNITFEGEIIPPRLNAKNKVELYKFAEINFQKTYEILKKYNESLTNVLIINDISIYLHYGDKKYLLNTIKKSETFFGNSYYGSSIKKNFSTYFSLKERFRVKYLLIRIDKSYLTK
ncbi:MAG: hypothetical protein ACFFAO_00795 [Candidatus Hermodarchaeota archaeon]